MFKNKTQSEKTPIFLPLTNIERMKSISDNIFGFAMTLLILGIHIPDLPKDISNAALLNQIDSQWPEFLTYIISFLNIGGYWMLHHNIFAFLIRTNRALTQLNLLFLLTVTFLPYPTALHGKYGRHSIVALVYGLTIAINYAMLFLLAKYAYNKPELVDPEFHTPIKKFLAFRLLLPLGFAISGAALAFHFVRLSFLFFLLVPLSNAIPVRWLLTDKE